MTAIVGILNRHAVAVAADSAETVGFGVKIYNKANKIFALSKYHPVGIAIFSNASFNSCIPWETVIKVYRKKLGKKFFPTLKEYEVDFYNFIADFRTKYIASRDEEKIFLQDIYYFWQSSILQRLPKSDAFRGIINPEDVQNIRLELNNLLLSVINSPVKDIFKDITKDQFKLAIAPVLRTMLQQIQNAGGNKVEFENLLVDTFYTVFVKRIDAIIGFTGIAFYGYGEDEIFPSLCKTQIYNAALGILYWEELKHNVIGNTNHGAYICPMAQTDVIKTYIEGISPEVEQNFISSTISAIENVINAIHAKLLPQNPQLANDVLNVDIKPVAELYLKKLNEYKKTSIVKPLMETIETMEKEDLAELAENLIYLTSLKRRITPNLESVGGPVDVAVISKGDGFIWIKRKHYFDPKLNKPYFNKYLNDYTEQIQNNNSTEPLEQ